MNFRSIYKIALSGFLLFGLGACGDLDIEPKYEVTSASVYDDFSNYKQVLAKLYAGYAVSGQKGPDGAPDISGIDEGFSTYMRQYWKAQELTTDEAVIAWNDGNLRDYHDMDWTASNEFIRAMYNRIYYQIAATNEFIRETADDKLNSRGLDEQQQEEIRTYRAEARFLRALTYWHALDMYGNVPFVTDADEVGNFFPEQASRQQLFDYIESELLEIESELVAARQHEYARADQAAAWTLLTKLYLNAEVYTGQQRYTDAVTYAERVINAGFSLEPEYENLFLADNNTASGIIFPIAFDGQRTRSWGGMTFLVHAAVGGNMNAAAFGINGGWAGLRVTPELVDNFPDTDQTPDERAMFHTDGQSLEINDIFTFTDGLAVTKFKNVTRDGQAGSDPAGNFPDTDFPMFRLADVYLMYAEAVLRGGAGGDAGTALSLVNQLRERAYDGTGGNINANQLTLDFILAERARELYWEGHRRTDLIRFGQFTGTEYVWSWKGGVQEGIGVEAFRTLFPIPTTDLISNPKLEQNEGYN